MSQHLFPKSHRSLSMNSYVKDNGQSRFSKNETISYGNLHQTGNQTLLYEGGQKDDSNEQSKESNNNNNDDNNTLLSAQQTPTKIPVNSPNKNVVVTSESKKVNGMNFQVVSMQPSKKQQVDKNLLKHFKQIQENDYNNWNMQQGGTGTIINTKFTQRPGLGDQQQNIEQEKGIQTGIYVDENGVGAQLQNLNSRKLSNSGQQNGKNQFVEEQKQYLKNEEKRFRCMLDLMLKFRDWEEEKIKVQLMQGSGNQTTLNENAQNDGQNQGLEDAVPNMEHYAFQSAQTQLQYIQNNLKTEFVNFKPLKDSSILVHNGQSTIYFQKGAILNSYMNMNESSVDMYFKLIKCEAKLLRSVLENNGFQQTETHDWNVLWSSQSYKQYVYDNLNEYQKINHFPNSFELTRKDRLCVNVVKLQEKFGKEAFDIIPDTYNLPDEFADFYSHFHQLRQQQENKRGLSNSVTIDSSFNQWIIKPTNSSQGRGIFIIDDISEVPIDEPCIVSRYVPNPLLINGLKFDVRIYVLVTSMDPWRIYVYQEGLARFASEEYDPQNIKSNKFAHLTNYSINKKSEKFVQNQSADQSDEGHKWSLGALSKHLEQMGVDMDILWSKIYDVILKSFIAVDGQIQSHLRKINSSNNCFELLGFDVLIDTDLKPWLMEVNLSPSLACDSPIDLKIKHGLFVDAMNLVCMRKFDRRRENLNKMKQRAKNIVRAKSYQNRTEVKPPTQKSSDNKIHISKALNAQGCYQLSINNKAVLEKVQNVQPKQRDILRETLQEHFRKGGFLRIYPSKTSNVYDKYFQQSPKTISQEMNTMSGSNGYHHSRISNKILYKMLYTDELVPYQSLAVMKNYNRTFSRFQKMPIANPECESSENTPTILKGNNSSSNDLSNHLIQKSGRIADSSFSQNRKILNSENKKSFQKLNKLHAIHNQNPMNNLTHSPQKQFISKRSGFASEQTSSNNRFLPALGSANNNGPKKGEKLLITGDDILIEYVARLMIAVRSMKENMLKAQWVYQIEKFIKHTVWHSSDVRRKQNNKLWQRLESRLIEMKERRKRLLQSLYKKELKTLQEAHNVQPGMAQAGFSANRQAQQIELEQFQKEYKLREEQKNVIIQGFSAQQLEDMLHTSTKNVAYEVISCLISADKSSEKEKNLEPSSASKFSGLQQSTVSCKGVLTDIIKWLTMTNQQQTLQDVEFSILDQISTKQNRSNSKYDIYGMQGSNQKGGNMDRRRRVPMGNRTKMGQHNYGIGGQSYEDETESYQPNGQRSRLKNASNNCLQQQSFVQNDDTYILDGKSSTTRKLNPNAQARLRNVSNQNTLEGNDLLQSPAQVDYDLDGFGNLPSPHRHLGSSSMKTKQNLVKLDNDGAITVGQNSTMLQGGSKNMSGLSSLSGLTALSGIKSLQSTAKKNRIIINDDLRTHHQQKQQKLNQQSQNPSSRESREMDSQNFTVRNFDLDMNDNNGDSTFDQTKKGENKQEKINNRDLILVSDLSASGRSKSGVSINSRDSNTDDLDSMSNVNKETHAQDYRHTEPEQQQTYDNIPNLEDKDVFVNSVNQENTFDNRRKLSKNALAVNEPLIGGSASTIPQSNKKSTLAQKQKTIVLNKNMINFSSQGQQETLASLNKKDNYQSVAPPSNSLVDGKQQQEPSVPTQIKPKKFMQTPKNLKAKIKNKQ